MLNFKIRKMKKTYKLFFLLILITSFNNKLFSQNIVEDYEQKKNDSIRIGIGDKDGDKDKNEKENKGFFETT